MRAARRGWAARPLQLQCLIAEGGGQGGFVGWRLTSNHRLLPFVMLASRLASSSRAVVRLAPFSQRFASGKPQGWELGQSLGSYLGFGLTKEYLSEVHKNAPPILQGPGTELGGVRTSLVVQSLV